MAENDLYSDFTVNRNMQKIFSTQKKIYTYNQISEFSNNFSEVIGKGGYGSVYKGKIRNLPVAIKKYSVKDLASFYRELLSIFQCNHPNVVQILGVSFEKEFYIVLEYMAKGSLQDYINKREGCIQMDKIKLLNVLIELCDTLDYLHAGQMIHRDIKPGNILFDEYEKPKFADFNLAVFYNDNESCHPNSIAIATAVYSDPILSQRTDIAEFVDMYSFGITMLVLLSEKVSIVGIYGIAYDIFDHKNEEALKSFFKLDWSPQIAMMLLRCAMECTKSNTRDRYTAARLGGELRKILKLESKNKEIEERVIADIMAENEKLKEERQAIEKQYHGIRSRYNELLNTHKIKLSIMEKIKEDREEIKNENLKLKRMIENVKEKANDPSVVKDILRNDSLTNQILYSSTLESLEMSNSIYYDYKHKPSLSASSSAQSTENEEFLLLYFTSGKEKEKRTLSKKMLKLKSSEESSNVEDTELENKNIIQMKNVESIKDEFEDFIKICTRIVFCNIKEWEIQKLIHIKNSIILESNKEMKLSFENKGGIEIEGAVEVEMKNFQMKDKKYNNSHNCIHLRDKAKLSVKDCNFQKNSIKHTLFHVHRNSSLELINCIFDGNVTPEPPTCILTKDDTFLKMKNCTFKNHSSEGKGYEGSDNIIKTFGNVEIENCYFENNQSLNSRKFLILSTGKSKLKIKDTSINKCSNIMFSENTTAEIQNCTFQDNCDSSASGGALILTNNADIHINSSYFIKNKAANGGAAFCKLSSKLALTSCHFQFNESSDKKSGDGGALLLVDYAEAKVKECIFSNNKSQDTGAAVAVYDGASLNLIKTTFENNASRTKKGHCLFLEKKSCLKEDIENTFDENDKNHVYIKNIKL